MEESIGSRLWASQLWQYERQRDVERLLKVVIEGIEAQQKNQPSILSGESDDLILQFFFRTALQGCRRRRDFAGASAIANGWSFYRLMKRVEREDKILLREVLSRAVRSIRETFVQNHVILPSIFEEVYNSVNRIPNYVSACQPGSELAFAFNAAVAAVLHLLAFVFQYLIGYVDRGGSKTFSSGAFDFRATFVSLVLFQGAYVWIKFRQAAPPSCRKRKAPAPDTTTDLQLADGCDRKGIYNRVQSTGTIKYEARFRPPKEKVDGGTNIRSERLDLGEYHTCAEAMIVLQIARCYYDDSMDEGCLELQDGLYKFSIPPMNEQERGLTGEERRKWVKLTAKQVGKQVYADFQRKKGKLKSAMAVEAAFHAGHGNVAGSSVVSLSALPPNFSYPAMLTTIADETAIASRSPPSPSLPWSPSDVLVGDSDPDLSIEPVAEPGLRSGRNLQQGRAVVVVGTQNIDGVGSSIFLQQSDPVLQQVGLCEKKLLEDTARQFADKNHRLTVFQRQNSELQKENEFLQLEKERLRTENERLKSRLREVAKISSCDLD